MRRESGVAVVNGAELFYELAGAGPPVALVHAGVADGRMWNEQVEMLAERRFVLRYDVRGFGRSTLPGGPFSHADAYRPLSASK